MKKIMYITITAAIWLLLFNAYAAYAQVTYLDAGEKVDHYPKVEWLRGVPLERFEKDKIYVIELWATWCRPCIEALPHLSDLESKFGDKIVFIGQNVMDPDSEKVKAFIARNEKIMNYRIAYGGMQESDFYKNWMKPSATMGIPRTFVIQNNILVWMTSPSELNERVLQLLVDKKFSVEAAQKLK
jgi:thiol-disulfide isomerase/thioredoxin